MLGPAVEEISISPAVVKKISEGKIDHAWIKALEELEKRSRAIDNKLRGPDKILAASDLKPLLEDLTSLVRNPTNIACAGDLYPLQAIERIRDFLVSQIKSLRSPSINAQIIQQRAFLAYKDLYAFLARHHALLAEQIGQAYINTMRWYYLSHFTRYKMSLEKILLYTVDKYDVLGADHPNQKGVCLAILHASRN